MNQVNFDDVHAVMAEALATGLFRSLCTIQRPSGTIGPSGAPDGAYSSISGLVGIVCMDAPQPPSEIKLGAYEKKAPGDVLAVAIRHVLLGGFYPAIADGWREGWRAIIATDDSSVIPIIYDITGVESDSQRTQTRLELHLASAGDVQVASGVVSVSFEGSSTGFILGPATTVATTGEGTNFVIEVTEVGPGGELQNFTVTEGGSGYEVGDAGSIISNGGGVNEPYTVTEVG